MMNSNNKIKIIASISLVFFALMAQAQGAPPATPIDGGLSMLLVAGGVYGIRKLQKNRHNSSH